MTTIITTMTTITIIRILTTIVVKQKKLQNRKPVNILESTKAINDVTVTKCNEN